MEDKSEKISQDARSDPAMAATSATPGQSEPSARQDTPTATVHDMAVGFVGRWNQLVSTTNWEKGHIICEWREALLEAGQPVTDYSDEAWAQLVGHVTSQHVGRLRRVYLRFEDEYEQYQGLYWSHFQAALDWSDAEMWLEGAIRGEWSVSQMRGRRWETLGTLDCEQAEQATLDAAAEEEILDEDGAEPVSLPNQSGTDLSRGSTESGTELQDHSPTSSQAVPVDSEGDDRATDLSQEQSSSELSIQGAARQRLGVVCDDLPDDIAEAFEQFKLAIIAQRHEGWRAISREGVMECLDALKELVGMS